jgi:hypothetical protein
MPAPSRTVARVSSVPGIAQTSGLNLHRQRELSSRQTRGLVMAVACTHIVLLWLALQVPAVRQAVRQVVPMMVDLVAPPEPQHPTPPPPPLPPTRPKPVQPPPVAPPLLAAPVVEAAPQAAFTTPPPPAEPPPQPMPASFTPAPAPPAPPPPTPRRVVAATAVQYLVLPPVEVPRASRRAGEQRRGLAACGGGRDGPAGADGGAAFVGLQRAWTNRRCGPCARRVSSRRPTTAPRSSSK